MTIVFDRDIQSQHLKDFRNWIKDEFMKQLDERITQIDQRPVEYHISFHSFKRDEQIKFLITMMNECFEKRLASFFFEGEQSHWEGSVFFFDPCDETQWVKRQRNEYLHIRELLQMCPSSHSLIEQYEPNINGRIFAVLHVPHMYVLTTDFDNDPKVTWREDTMRLTRNEIILIAKQLNSTKRKIPWFRNSKDYTLQRFSLESRIMSHGSRELKEIVAQMTLQNMEKKKLCDDLIREIIKFL